MCPGKPGGGYFTRLAYEVFYSTVGYFSALLHENCNKKTQNNERFLKTEVLSYHQGIYQATFKTFSDLSGWFFAGLSGNKYPGISDYLRYIAGNFA